jgi:hypothetical protein
VIHGVFTNRDKKFWAPEWNAVCRLRPADMDHLPSKDRYNVIRDGTPFNLGEILRAAGLDVPRVKEVEVYEPIIQEVAWECLDDMSQVKAKLTELQSALADEPKHVRRWVMRDVWDRIDIRNRLK